MWAWVTGNWQWLVVVWLLVVLWARLHALAHASTAAWQHFDAEIKRRRED
jgi:hypothetical protein